MFSSQTFGKTRKDMTKEVMNGGSSNSRVNESSNGKFKRNG